MTYVNNEVVKTLKEKLPRIPSQNIHFCHNMISGVFTGLKHSVVLPYYG